MLVGLVYFCKIICQLSISVPRHSSSSLDWGCLARLETSLLYAWEPCRQRNQVIVKTSDRSSHQTQISSQLLSFRCFRTLLLQRCRWQSWCCWPFIAGLHLRFLLSRMLSLGRSHFRERLFRCCCQHLEHGFLPMGLTQANVKAALTFKDLFQVFWLIRILISNEFTGLDFTFRS